MSPLKESFNAFSTLQLFEVFLHPIALLSATKQNPQNKSLTLLSSQLRQRLDGSSPRMDLEVINMDAWSIYIVPRPH